MKNAKIRLSLKKTAFGILRKSLNIKKYIDKGQMSLYNSNIGKGQKCLTKKQEDIEWRMERKCM